MEKKKVVLLGDSIRLIGYGLHVPEMLGDEYEVWQPEDNCRFTFYTLRILHDFKDSIKGADVIHWNNGLWDVSDFFGDGSFTPIEVYVEQLKRIAGILKTYAPTVIFATTTVPAPNGIEDQNDERIKLFNKAAVEALEPMGIIINDIFPMVYGHTDEMICDDKLHLSEVGAKKIAARVADVIRDAVSK